jgi:hypothetical protein
MFDSRSTTNLSSQDHDLATELWGLTHTVHTTMDDLGPLMVSTDGHAGKLAALRVADANNGEPEAAFHDTGSEFPFSSGLIKMHEPSRRLPFLLKQSTVYDGFGAEAVPVHASNTTSPSKPVLLEDAHHKPQAVTLEHPSLSK